MASPGSQKAEPGRPAQRSDARTNRARIIAAARASFADRGIDVPLSAIARRAGVGPATLYRHFATRDALLTEVFAGQLAACDALLDEALQDPDPWRGFCVLLHSVAMLQVEERAFTDALLTRLAGTEGHERLLGAAEEKLRHLVVKAQRAGQLRRDFDPGDVTALIAANGGLVHTLGDEAPAAIRRQLAYLLQAFRADSPGADAAGPLPPVPQIGLGHLHRCR